MQHFTIQLTLVGVAFILTLVTAISGKVPLWISVLLVEIALLIPTK